MALAQVADQAPGLRALFRELADRIVQRALRFLDVLNLEASEADARLLHSLLVGLAVLDLATGRPDGEHRAAAVLTTALAMIGNGDRQELPAPLCVLKPC
jgi:hypothetical protein